jgi:hypothetical protein
MKFKVGDFVIINEDCIAKIRRLYGVYQPCIFKIKKIRDDKLYVTDDEVSFLYEKDAVKIKPHPLVRLIYET